ncbi:amidohydrolase [Catellatospora chokoriensis]|uniref:Hippurate hydrolase n=1 Tax=Catellatospora chokoriensis TaxID=310353 RepID=A0A8J3JT74_9ACTN|nr:amidohydrolase [Catellatospora chokoriensis]GIF86581.1 hippurate hydrolase [Catellatospora chokoriensis]
MSTGESVLSGVEEAAAAAGELYRDLHAHPELSGAEHRTAAALAARLRDAGFAVTEGVGGTGVVGVLRNGPGPTVLLRAELDALPVAEQTGLPYASRAAGEGAPVMHACGHDLHVAALAGAAVLLGSGRAHWAGTVLAVGQPAEETLTGARAMLDDGLYERFGRPDVVLAQHAAPLPAGMVAHGGGPMTAGSATFEVVVHGRGGHAGSPHRAVDPVVTAAAIVLRLQTVVSREVGPAEQVVLTVGTLHAGTQANVVPDRATLGLTVRSVSPDALARVSEAVRRVVTAECAASACPSDPEITLVSSSPVNINDPAAMARTRAAHEQCLGGQRVAWFPPSLATEDFPHFTESGAAGVYWMLGTVGPRQWAVAPGATATEKLQSLPANHSPRYAPDVDLALPTGIRALVSAALAHLDGAAPDGERSSSVDA